MAHLHYSNYAGYGETAKEKYYYSQAVRVGDVIHCSGQGACSLSLPCSGLQAAVPDLM